MRKSPINRIKYEVGQQIGNCIYLGNEYSKNWKRYALFKCHCGNEFSSAIEKVKRGHTKSCGCNLVKHLIAMNQTHGKTHTAEYSVWGSMKNRCNNPNCKEYKDYGARGISVSERWSNSFEDFLSDMGERPSDKHEIERVDNDKNYELSNCKWGLKKEQCLNRRSNFLVTHSGLTRPLKIWTDELGIDYFKTRKRIREYGWSPEKAFNTNRDARRTNS